tara:strand:- start:25 stop:267 length:243 start_codon:yes stop_codon:yes gene_type:complete
MNSEDFKCNTCGDYVGEEGVWGLCDPCFDKEGGNEALAKSFGHGKEAGLSVDDPAKLAALTEADFDDIDNLIPTPHGMIL